MWMLFIGELRRRWLEYALGVVAIALVVAALVANRAVTASAESSVHELAHRLGRNMLVVPGDTDIAAFHSQRFGPETLPDSAPETLRSSHVAQHIRSVEARLYGTASVDGRPVVVVGQDLGWPSLGAVQPVALGREVARVTGLDAGHTFRIDEETFSVLQVVEVAPDGLDGAVFMPLAAAQRVLGRPGQLSALRLGGCWCRIDVATLGKEVEGILPGARAITVAAMVEAQKGSVATMQRYSGVMNVVGIAVVAAVIATLMISQARRRTRELGLLVAIGAPPRGVAWMLTLQGVVVGAAGGILGWLAAFPLTSRAGEALLGAALTPAGESLVPAVALAVVVSAVAATIPAQRAAALDPTVVLRES